MFPGWQIFPKRRERGKKRMWLSAADCCCSALCQSFESSIAPCRTQRDNRLTVSLRGGGINWRRSFSSRHLLLPPSLLSSLQHCSSFSNCAESDSPEESSGGEELSLLSDFDSPTSREGSRGRTSGGDESIKRVAIYEVVLFVAN